MADPNRGGYGAHYQHQQWYGASQDSSSDFPGRQPHSWVFSGGRGRGSGSGRRCWFLYSVVRQFSLVIPIILVIMTAYAYAHGARYPRGTPPAGDSSWIPLYLAIPLSAANIIWSFAVIVDHRRSAYRGRPFSQELQLAVESVLTAGAVVCFVLMVVILCRQGNYESWDGGRGMSLAYTQSLGWLLGMQMVASGFLCGRAASEVLRERRERPQQEAYTIH
ncbi:uncharacterized protein DNG_08859 [Cephalotrichum gorgonifer]|uniref:Uncharacterized protein n=1 Tax=Cephalotrichum gorgonifer TaxID=2041049 RepID=A0AAE8N4J6_9PEZI|nr:uncharacterized protein DNG_08859 [Cephalotrichum gorgonifer]